MKIYVNSKEVETSARTLSELTTELALPTKGTAIAVNQKVVPRNTWEQHALTENDKIIIIKGTCGG